MQQYLPTVTEMTEIILKSKNKLYVPADSAVRLENTVYFNGEH